MSNMLINIPNDERVDGATPDSIKYHKDCDDFVCLDDGTIVRECKYCNLSLMCRQIDILPNGESAAMEGNILPVYDEKGQLVEHAIFCTGMFDLRSLKERLIDETVS